MAEWSVCWKSCAACVIRKGKRVLIAQRNAGEMLAGLWEFPGDKQEAGRADQDEQRPLGKNSDHWRYP